MEKFKLEPATKEQHLRYIGAIEDIAGLPKLDTVDERETAGFRLCVFENVNGQAVAHHGFDGDLIAKGIATKNGDVEYFIRRGLTYVRHEGGNQYSLQIWRTDPSFPATGEGWITLQTDFKTADEARAWAKDTYHVVGEK